MAESRKTVSPCAGCHSRFEGNWDITYVDDPGYSATLSFSCQGDAMVVTGRIMNQGRLVGYYHFAEVVCPVLPFPPQGVDMELKYLVQNAARDPLRNGRMTLHLFLENDARRINGRYYDDGGGEGMMLIYRQRLHGGVLVTVETETAKKE